MRAVKTLRQLFGGDHFEQLFSVRRRKEGASGPPQGGLSTLATHLTHVIRCSPRTPPARVRREERHWPRKMPSEFNGILPSARLRANADATRRRLRVMVDSRRRRHWEPANRQRGAVAGNNFTFKVTPATCALSAVRYNWLLAMHPHGICVYETRTQRPLTRTRTYAHWQAQTALADEPSSQH